MSNYVQSTNFATKDALVSGNALKIVKGTEINTEYANIAIAVATKADTTSPTFTGTLTAVNEVLTGTLSVAGTTTLSSALNYGGVTLSNSVTGTGSMVLSTSPTLTTPTLTTPNIGTPSAGVLTNCTGLPMTTGVTGTLPVANGGTGVTSSTGSGNNVLSTSPALTTPNIGTPSAGVLTSCTGLPMTTGVTGTLPVANGGTGVTTSTGSGNNVLSTSPALTTPNIGTPSAGVLTNCTGLPVTTGVTGTLPVANGGTGVTTSTGSGNNVLSTSPALTTPNIGTPSAGVLTSCTGLPMTTGVTGTLPVANGGTGVTASTGTTSVVLSASPTLTGTPLAPTAATSTNTTQLATTAFVQAVMQTLHPVGSIYTAIISTNPGTLFGFGTWAAFGAGRMLISLNSANPLFDTAEETGGSADSTLPTHTHTATSTDSGHTHFQQFSGGAAGTGAGISSANIGTFTTTVVPTDTGVASITTTVANAGVTGVNTNYPPFIAVYMWKRTA